MNGFGNFNRTRRPQETSVITLPEENSPIILNGRYLTSENPILLFKCMKWTGLVEKPTRHPLDRIATITFKIVFIYINLDSWISSGVSFHSLDWKTTFTNLAICILVAGIYIAMYSKRNLLTVTLFNLDLSSHKKVINFIVFVVLCIPAVLSTLRVIAHHNDSVSSRFETYGYKISNVWIRIMVF
ncbi:hypothetical protein TNIN_197471 [Trichonephila inaurata madagascariensis]|uniref:Uncharacterized protein n=1 Tax=Trichonephila inaurata madagascariensis TaxID=2747483 RepID=A0A8X6Y8S3_9ARAC|nr:hypothetical protein TNIN_197471 [Trichonephila inaurata madagascariensis]